MQGRARLWDTGLKYFSPVLRIMSPDHLDVAELTFPLFYSAIHRKATKDSIGDFVSVRKRNQVYRC